jgi:hypothetical protein
MKILLALILIFSGCGYSLGVQAVIAPDSKELNQETQESNNGVSV